jgi:hypothetical protein
MNLRFHKVFGNSRLTSQLETAQEGLISMELILISAELHKQSTLGHWFCFVNIFFQRNGAVTPDTAV